MWLGAAIRRGKTAGAREQGHGRRTRAHLPRLWAHVAPELPAAAVVGDRLRVGLLVHLDLNIISKDVLAVCMACVRLLTSSYVHKLQAALRLPLTRSLPPQPPHTH